MDTIQLNINKNMLWNISSLIICMVLLVTFSGCLENYGRVKRNTEVTRAFESNQVPSNYKYYYFGRSNMPYVVIGINPGYSLQSRMWREVEPDTERFKKMTYWIWSDHWYYPRGANIVDPAGNKIGIWYSSAYWAAVKMKDDQGNIMIAPDTPWMRGNR